MVTPGAGKLSTRQLFALGFGCTVGIGWITLWGAWLGMAGPVGAAIGIAAGGVAILPIALTYAGLIERHPGFTDIDLVASFYGPWSARVVTAALAFALIAVAGFEAISTGLLAGSLLPGVGGSPLYSFNGQSVNMLTSIAAVAGSLILYFINSRGVGTGMAVQGIAVSLKIALFSAIAVACIILGEPGNLTPAFSVASDGTAPWRGIISVAIAAPLFYSGFQVVAEFSGRADPGSVRRALIGTILAAIAFYAISILAFALASPWQATMASPVPILRALEPIDRWGILHLMLIFCGFVSIAATWNGIVIWACGLLERLNGGDRRAALRWVCGISALLALGGAGMIGPIVVAASAILSLMLLLVCVGSLHRKMAKSKPVALCGAIAATLLAGAALAEPVRPGAGFPVAWLLLLLVSIGCIGVARKTSDVSRVVEH